MVKMDRLRKSKATKVLLAILIVPLVLGSSWMILSFTMGGLSTVYTSPPRVREEIVPLEPQIGFGPPGGAPVRPGIGAPIEVQEPAIVGGPAQERVVEVEVPGPDRAVGEVMPGGQVVPFQAIPDAQDRLVVFVASISINVTNVQRSVAELDFLASSLGGYISQSNIRPIQRGSRVEQGVLAANTFQAVVTLRIPSDKYSEATAQIINMGELLSMSTSSSDATDQYIDLQARITNLERVLDQYRLILSRAEEIGDIISVQSRIDNIQEQIERLKASSRQLENQITFASIAVGLIEPPVLEEDEEEEEVLEESPFEKIFNETVAFASVLLQVEVRGLLILIIGLAPIYPILAIAYLLYRRYQIRIRDRSQQKE